MVVSKKWKFPNNGRDAIRKGRELSEDAKIMGWKYNTVEWYICQKARFGQGKDFFGFFAGLVEFYVLAKIYVKLILDVELAETYYIAGGISLALLYWMHGYIWDKKGGFVIANEWSNKRNAFMIDMRKKFNLKERLK